MLILYYGLISLHEQHTFDIIKIGTVVNSLNHNISFFRLKLLVLRLSLLVYSIECERLIRFESNSAARAMSIRYLDDVLTVSKGLLAH